MPERDDVGRRERLESLKRTIGADGRDPGTPTQVVTAALAHLDRADVEARLLGGDGERAGARPDLDQAPRRELVEQQPHAIRGGTPALGIALPCGLSVWIKAVVVGVVVATQVGRRVVQKERATRSTARVGEALGGRLPVAVSRDERPRTRPAAESAAISAGAPPQAHLSDHALSRVDCRSRSVPASPRACRCPRAARDTRRRSPPAPHPGRPAGASPAAPAPSRSPASASAPRADGDHRLG